MEGFFISRRIKHQFRKSAFSHQFHKMWQMQNLSRGSDMENREMVMEKSWKTILQSLWEPCTNLCTVYVLQRFILYE